MYVSCRKPIPNDMFDAGTLAARPSPPGEKLPSKSETNEVSKAFSGPQKGGAPTPEEIRRLVAAVNKR